MNGKQRTYKSNDGERSGERCVKSRYAKPPLPERTAQLANDALRLATADRDPGINNNRNEHQGHPTPANRVRRRRTRRFQQGDSNDDNNDDVVSVRARQTFSDRRRRLWQQRADAAAAAATATDTGGRREYVTTRIETFRPPALQAVAHNATRTPLGCYRVFLLLSIINAENIECRR